MDKQFTFHYRVYYEDTDAGGVVYYANYLKFTERARTDMLREIGIDQSKLLEQDLAFVVRKVEADYIRPARLDDMLKVTVEVQEIRKASMVIVQSIYNEEHTKLFEMTSLIASICPSRMKPVAMPDMIRSY